MIRSKKEAGWSLKITDSAEQFVGRFPTQSQQCWWWKTFPTWPLQCPRGEPRRGAQRGWPRSVLDCFGCSWLPCVWPHPRWWRWWPPWWGQRYSYWSGGRPWQWSLKPSCLCHSPTLLTQSSRGLVDRYLFLSWARWKIRPARRAWVRWLHAGRHGWSWPCLRGR